MADLDEIDWFDLNNTNIVVRQQMALAVFRNQRDEVAIRQQNEGWEQHEPEAWITFHPEHAAAVIRAIAAVAGLDLATIFRDSAPSVGVSAIRPKDRTAADRQRRHRDKRNGCNGVTLRDVTVESATRDGADAPGPELEPAGITGAGR